MATEDTQTKDMEIINDLISFTDNFEIKVECESDNDQLDSTQDTEKTELLFYDIVYVNKEDGKLVEQKIDINTSFGQLEKDNEKCQELKKELMKQNIVKTKTSIKQKNDINGLLTTVIADHSLVKDADVNKEISLNVNNNCNELDIFQCKECSNTFKSKEESLEHTKAFHGNIKSFLNPEPCIQRDLFGEGTEQNLLKPIRAEHETIITTFKETKCKKCSRTMTCDKKNKICKDCPAKFNPEVQLLEKSKHDKSEKLYTCEICSKKLRYKSWHGHMQQVHGSGELQCTHCDKVFKCKSYLKKHMRFIHLGVPRSRSGNIQADAREECPKCPKFFKEKHNLSLHIKNCHGEESECDICHAKFDSLPYLNIHKRRVHCDDGNKYKCIYCSKVFKSPRRVSIHLKNAHKNKVAKKCDACKQFCDASDFKSHHKICLTKKVDVSVKIEQIDVTD